MIKCIMAMSENQISECRTFLYQRGYSYGFCEHADNNEVLDEMRNLYPNELEEILEMV